MSSKGKIKRVSTVRRILDNIGVDHIFFDPFTSEIFYFTHVEASNALFFVGNPDVDSLASLATPSQF